MSHVIPNIISTMETSSFWWAIVETSSSPRTSDRNRHELQVENILFNVHRSTFTRHSLVFRDVLGLPMPKSSPDIPNVVEGSSDELPLQFLGISSVDFERLLWILYPP